ncbi:AAC(3) family N-acetyltransferase [Verrucomicrobiales bacterium]|nr:AAC(3) family N-acetyltransferase [Verrucomicrobiales bacterium]
MGVSKGDVLLVHSSLSSLGYVPGGPATIIEVLREAIGAEGTLVFPTQTWEQINAGLDCFNVRGTASCVGKISDFFRQQKGVLRSLHPTHSVAAAGPKAEFLVHKHEFATSPCGEGTPYERILRADGKILLLGVGLESNTCFHCLEAMNRHSWLLREEPCRIDIVDYDGCKTEHLFYLQQERIKRAFPQTESFLSKNGAIEIGKLGKARCLLIEGGRFLDLVQSQLIENPRWLLKSTTDF